MKRILIILSLFAANIMVGGAQDIATATIKWTSASTFHAADGITMEEGTLLVTYGSKIEWRNSDGSVRKSYQILEVMKVWNNVTSPGSAHYKISDGDNGGVIVIENAEGFTKAKIAIGSEEPELYELTITSFEVL